MHSPVRVRLLISPRYRLDLPSNSITDSIPSCAYLHAERPQPTFICNLQVPADNPPRYPS